MNRERKTEDYYIMVTTVELELKKTTPDLEDTERERRIEQKLFSITMWPYSYTKP